MKKKAIILLCIALSLMLGFGIYRYAQFHNRILLTGETVADHFSHLVVTADENGDIPFDVTSYFDGEQFVLFLPTGVDPENVTYYSVATDGSYMERFQTNFLLETGEVLGVPVVAMMSDLPSLCIHLDEQYGTLQDVEASENHSVYAYGDMTLTVPPVLAKQNGWEEKYVSKGRKNGSKGSMKMRGRGNYTWTVDKKPYLVQLNRSMDLLGMGQSKNWVLLANAEDYSLIRDEVFYNLASDCNVEYPCPIQQIDLFINGEYRGAYCLTTHVEIADNRVNIQNDHDYLIRWGMPDEGTWSLDTEYFQDKENRVAQLIDSKDPTSAENAKVISQRFMDLLKEDSDEVLSMIDMTSFARYYWIQEFAKNVDATSRSFYTVWKADEGKLYVGPVWDMDFTAGVVEPFEREYDYLYPEGFSVRHEGWFEPLFQRPEFVNEVKRVYYEEGIREAFENSVNELDARREYNRKSANMNFTRWDVLDAEQNNQIVKWMGVSTYDSQNEWLKEWLTQRVLYFENNMDDLGK